ncbi:MAG: hypothetical protein ACKVOJ_06335 [Sphingomonadaceae bacterium]
MAIAGEALATVKTRLCNRIDSIAQELPHLTRFRLAHEVDDVRRIANDHGLIPVVELARGLESALSASQDHIMILPFLDSMRDAVSGERTDSDAAQCYLTRVNQRLHG